VSAAAAPRETLALLVLAPPVRLAGRLRVLMQQRGYALLPGDGALPPDGFALLLRARDKASAWLHPDRPEALPDSFALLLSAELGARVTAVVHAPPVCAYEVCERGQRVEHLAARDAEILDSLASPHAAAVLAGTPLAERLAAAGLADAALDFTAASAVGRATTLRFAPANARKSADVLEIDPLVTCPVCGAPTALQTGRFGPFHGCVRFPDCRGRRTVAEAARLRASR